MMEWNNLSYFHTNLVRMYKKLIKIFCICMDAFLFVFCQPKALFVRVLLSYQRTINPSCITFKTQTSCNLTTFPDLSGVVEMDEQSSKQRVGVVY